MIIACPACTTRYVVPDDAIGVEGRVVRCAKCKNSWHQDGPAIEVPADWQNSGDDTGVDTDDAGITQPASPPSTRETVPAANMPSADRAEDHADAPAPPRNYGDASPPPARDAANVEPDIEDIAQASVVQSSVRPDPTFSDDDDLSQFDYQPPFRGRRNPLKLWTAAAALFAVLALGSVAAVSYWGLPDWLPFEKPTFAVEQPDLVLDFPPQNQDRRTLPNDTEFFGASGTVTNVGRETRRLPSILIVLTDARDREVFTWEVAPPQPTIAPGEKVSINEAMADVPKSAKYAEIGWKPN